MNKDEAIRKAKNFDEILDIQYGKVGTEPRNEFEEKAQYFVISELLKDARREANMTQEELATKIGTKKAIYPGLKMASAIYNYLRFIRFSNMDLDARLIYLLVD